MPLAHYTSVMVMELLKVGDRTLRAEELMPMLGKMGLLPRLVQEVILEEAIAEVNLSPEEATEAEAEFYQRNQINNAEEAQVWAKQRYGLPDLVRDTALREKRLEKFKQITFGKDVDSYFLQRKSRLDRVIYSLIRTKQVGLAQELYFRIHDDGQSFADLAREYSDGQESKTGGLIGPVELSVPHPMLGGLLSISKPGQVWPPKKIGEWYVVVRLEKFFPAQLDEAMHQRLLDELFQQWMQQKLQTLPVSVPASDEMTVDHQAIAAAASTTAPPNPDALKSAEPSNASRPTPPETPPQTMPAADFTDQPQSEAGSTEADPWS